MNILVTGANGQLGNELRRLAPNYTQHAFLFTDVAELDITNRAAVQRCVLSFKPALLINCAAYTAVNRAESQPDLAALLNANAPRLLAEEMLAVGGLMLHVSTDYVFDGTAHRPYTEEAPTAPQTVYGRTKLEGEQAVLETCPGSAVVRTAWLYSSFGMNFVKTMMRLQREKEELGVIADQIGTPTYARDLARALLNIADYGIIGGVYHFTDEGVCSWYDFACNIQNVAREISGNTETCRILPLRTEQYPTPARRPHYSVLDKSKIKATYGLTIPWWQDSLRECIRELLSTEAL